MKVGLVVLNGQGAGENLSALVSHGLSLVRIGHVAGRDCDALLLWIAQPEERAIGSAIAIRGLMRDQAVLAHINAPDDLRAHLLRHGIDDLVDEHCGPAELAARLHMAVARRQGKDAAIQVGALTLDRLGRQAWMAGTRLRLMPREFELLAYLAERAPAVVRRDELRAKLWGRDFDPGTNSVDVHVCRLRRKLEEQGAQNLIHTVRGAGYCVAQQDGIGPQTRLVRTPDRVSAKATQTA